MFGLISLFHLFNQTTTSKATRVNNWKISLFHLFNQTTTRAHRSTAAVQYRCSIFSIKPQPLEIPALYAN